MKRSDYLFSAGADALALVRPDLAGKYYCPLCLSEHESVNGLTEEHVPPRSMKGKVICLTCRPCNNAAGHMLDYNFKTAAIASHTVKALEGRAIWKVGDHDLNVDIRRQEDGSIAISHNPKNNNPEVSAAVFDNIESHLKDGSEFQIARREKFDRNALDVARLRVAYLLAFARYGYAYILRTAMEGIRRQISNPKENIVPGQFIAWTDEPERQIIGLTRPRDLLLVRWDKLIIFLPGLRDHGGAQYYEHLKQEVEHVKLDYGTVSEWPKSLAMEWDKQNDGETSPSA